MRSLTGHTETVPKEGARRGHGRLLKPFSNGRRKMNYKCLILMAIAASVLLSGPSPSSAATAPVLRSAQGFAVLGGSTVTNTGSSTITGNVGVYAGSAITGFPPGTVAGGTIHGPDAVSLQAQKDVTIAYNGLAAMPFTSDLTGLDLGGRTLISGVYHFDTEAQLTGLLKLDAQGNNNAFWVFQIGSTLTTASNSVVQVIQLGTNDGKDDGVFWQVGSSATLGTGTAFEGNILALDSITLTTNATILNGRALARTGAVTLDTNTISIVCPNGGPGFSGGLGFDANGDLVPVVPEPRAWLLAGCGLLGLLVNRPRRTPSM
jgi:hypothetical protein